MTRPLDGIRVLDLSWALSGPFATMVLADLGAEVIKVERPGSGDISRGNGPFVQGTSSYFLSLNRGKKSIVLDLKTIEGKAALLKLAKHVDVLVENFVPGTMKRLGLGYEEIRKHNHMVIYAAISGFGQTGPLASKPALDIIVQAMGGLMSVTGEPGGGPIRSGASLGDIVAGLFAAVGILAALEERRKSGFGQMLDIGMLDCQVAILENAFARYFATGEVPRPLGTRHPVLTPFQAYETRDGYIAVAIVGHQWPLFCAAIQRPELIDDPRFETGYMRSQNYDILHPIIMKAFKSKTTLEWLEELEGLEIACGPVNTIDKVAVDTQVMAREMLVEINQPGIGAVRVTNTPMKFSRTPCRAAGPSPELGEHTDSVLSSLTGE